MKNKFMKTELEEVAERLVPEAGCELNNSEASYWQQGWIKGCVEGAKWQQERMYSEKEVEFIERLISFYWTEYNSEHSNNLKEFELSKSILEKLKKK